MLLLAAYLIIPGFVHIASGTGHIDVHFLRYSDTCREDLGFSACDPMFSFCLSIPQSSNSLTVDNCNYASTGESSGHYQNTNIVDMEHLTSILGHSNPWEVLVTRFIEPSVMLVIRVRDADIIEHDHLQTWGKVLTEIIWPTKEQAVWTEHVMSQNSYTMRFKVRMYCDPYYYTQKCDKYCKPDDSSTGHYTCEPNTGNKICLPGWRGDQCTEDMDECALGYCVMGECVNLPGDYNCNCLANYTGKNCSTMLNPCRTDPCQNNGDCFAHSSEHSFICNCTEEWIGETCENRKDPCQLQPCLNNGSCTKSLNGTGYNCICVYPYMGDHCDVAEPTDTSTINTTSLEITFTTSDAVEVSNSTIKTTPELAPPSKAVVTMMESTTAKAHLAAENVPQVRHEDGNGNFQLWYIAIIVGAMVIIITVVAFFLVRRRRRKATHDVTPASSPIVSFDGTNLIFENGLYTDVNRNISETERQARNLPPVPPLPTTPTEDDLFNPTKPSYVEMDETGATGGATGGTTVDCSDNDLKKMKSTSKDMPKDSSTLQTRPLSERAQSNPYADFRSLTDLQQENHKIDNHQEENHYHDLFEIVTSMQEAADAEKVDAFANATLNFDLQATPFVREQTSPYDTPPNNASYYATPPKKPNMVTPLQPQSPNLTSSSSMPGSDNLMKINASAADDDSTYYLTPVKNLVTAADDLVTDSSGDDDDAQQEDLTKLRQEVKNTLPKSGF